MSGKIDKLALREFIKEDLVSTIETYRARLKDQKINTSQQSSAMQSRYDTFREESQAMEAGIAKQLSGLERELDYAHNFPVGTQTEKVQGGSLIHVIRDGEEHLFFLVPFCGGKTYSFQEMEITVIAPVSPLGQAFLHKRGGDTFRVGESDYRVEAIE